MSNNAVWSRVVLLVLTTVTGLSAVQADDVPRTKKALFIGIDGTRWDALEAAETPHIDRLIAEGFLAVGTDIIAPRETPGDTVSGPGWSNLLCGVWPDKHGVIDNSFKGANYDRYPHFFARLKQARPTMRTASFSNWGPITQRIVRAADYQDAFDSKGAADYTAVDGLLAASCATHVRQADPDVVMLYLGQIDETGHARGFHPRVPEYVAAIERVDRHVGLVVEGLRRRPKFAEEDWLILIATDHGGLGTNHAGGRQQPEIRNTFLIVSGPSAERGRLDTPSYQVDVVATIATHLGIAIAEDWDWDGRAVGLKAEKNTPP